MSYFCIWRVSYFRFRIMQKKRTLQEKIQVRINKSPRLAFIPSDFFDLSDRDQVGRVLRTLVRNKKLVRLGQGIYAKTKPGILGDKPVLAAGFTTVAKDALAKLKVNTYPSRAEQAYNSGESTQIPTGLMIGVNNRISRKLTYNGRSIKYERVVQR